MTSMFLTFLTLAHFRHGQHIPNSPFKIYVGESEIGNAGKVKVSGKGLTEGMANELNEFFVNTKDAGQYIGLVYMLKPY